MNKEITLKNNVNKKGNISTSSIIGIPTRYDQSAKTAVKNKNHEMRTKG